MPSQLTFIQLDQYISSCISSPVTIQRRIRCCFCLVIASIHYASGPTQEMEAELAWVVYYRDLLALVTLLRRIVICLGISICTMFGYHQIIRNKHTVIFSLLVVSSTVLFIMINGMGCSSPNVHKSTGPKTDP